MIFQFTMVPERPAWAEISISAIAENTRTLVRLAGQGSKLCAVVKADAYGHGALPVARAALEAGAYMIAVALVDEAIELRRGGIAEPILVLGAMPPAQAGRALEAGLEVTVFTKEAAAVFSSVASTRRKRARLHLKVDTGMNRIGCRPDEAADLASYIHRLPATELASVYSHFATADDPDPTFARRQLELFLRVVSEVESRGIDVPLRHIANSAATLWLPESRLDLVRCGIALYGLLPRADRPLPGLSLEPALSIKARVTRISNIKKGDSTSYGRTWTADRDGRIATISLGYADGYPRSASGRGWAGFSGRRIPQRGSVCMDMCMFDATDAPELDTGSELVLMGPGGPSLEEVASWAGTINYEIACHAALRLPRVYIEGSR